MARTIHATGLGYVPEGATAVVVNVTDVAPSSSGYLTVYPRGSPPKTSDIGPPVGGTAASLVVATLTHSGTFNVYNFSSPSRTNLIVDVTGWYSLQSP